MLRLLQILLIFNYVALNRCGGICFGVQLSIGKPTKEAQHENREATHCRNSTFIILLYRRRSHLRRRV